MKDTGILKAGYVFSRLYCDMLLGREAPLFGILLRQHREKNMEKLKRIAEFKDIHKGERCYIVGTGPSLTLQDINLLSGTVSFGVNTLFRLYDQTDWRATYYCIIDPGTYSNIKEDFISHDVKNLFYPLNRFRGQDVSGIAFELECSDFYKKYASEIIGFTQFSEDAGKLVYDGASVVYAAMQLAVYMGFSEIVLIGVDCNYGLTNTLHNKRLEYKNYNYHWNRDTALTMIEGFKVAKRYANEHDIRIYNATRGGMLEVFERRGIEELIQ